MKETAANWVGRVALKHSGDDCLLWPFSIGSHGYGQIVVNYEHLLAHRYVCELAHGMPDAHLAQAAHSCGNKICVNAKHIRWATRSENEIDKRAHGRDNRGERHGMAKLTVDQARKIKTSDANATVIAKEMGVSPKLVYLIRSGARWSWL